MQCKHIFYGCAFNDSSLATLEAYKYDPIMASSFTLIKSRAPEDLNIHIAFELVEFPAVFRSSSGAEDTTAGVGASVNGVNSRASATNRRTWFVPDRSRIPPSRNKIRKTQYNGSSRSSWDNAERIVLLNINNERVDPPAPNFNSIRFGKFMSRYEKKKLCHFHYLLGICNSLNCPYTHHVELNPEELNMFRYCTRRLRCSSGLSCRELRCIYGHICPYETAGFCKKGRECAFRSVHNVNRTAVKVWDGYDEPPSSTDGTPQNQFSETGGDEEEHEHEPGVYESAAEGMDIEDDSQGQAGPTLWATPWPRRSPFPWERKNGSTDSDQTKQSVPEARSTPPSAPEEDIPDIAQEEEKAKMAYIQYFTKK